MIKITFYVGQTDENGQPMQAVAAQWDAVQSALLKTYGGYSLSTVLGGWKDSLTEKVTTETTVVIEVIAEKWWRSLDDNTEVATEELEKWIKELFHQKSLLFTMEVVNGRFI